MHRAFKTHLTVGALHLVHGVGSQLPRVDLVAAQIIMQYWFADVPGWIWSALFLGVMFCINFFSAKSFGEAEFWFEIGRASCRERV